MSDNDFEIVFAGRVLPIGGRQVELDYPVQGAWTTGAVIVVLFDPDASRLTYGQFPNLVALRTDGTRAWTAELPTTTTGDCYYYVASINPLIAYSFSSFQCEIDIGTGRVINRTFTK